MAQFVIQDVREERVFSRLFLDVAKSFDFSEEKVKEAATSMKEELQRQICNEASGIHFDDILKCCGYVMRYASCHCALVRYSTQILFSEMVHYESSMLMRLMSRGSLKVVSVGGGPGNDLIGFCSALTRSRHRFHRLDLTVVDLKNEWKEVFSKVFSFVSERSYGDVTNLFRGIDVRTKFVAADLIGETTPSAIKSADFILMTKVLSIVPNEQKDKILQRIFASMKEGAIFLYTDIDADVVVRNSRNLGLLCLSKRCSFTYNRGNTASIFQSSYEICALRKIGFPSRRTPGIKAAARMNDKFCYDDYYPPYYSGFPPGRFGQSFQKFGVRML